MQNSKGTSGTCLRQKPHSLHRTIHMHGDPASSQRGTKLNSVALSQQNFSFRFLHLIFWWYAVNYRMLTGNFARRHILLYCLQNAKPVSFLNSHLMHSPILSGNKRQIALREVTSVWPSTVHKRILLSLTIIHKVPSCNSPAKATALKKQIVHTSFLERMLWKSVKAWNFAVKIEFTTTASQPMSVHFHDSHCDERVISNFSDPNTVGTTSAYSHMGDEKRAHNFCSLILDIRRRHLALREVWKNGKLKYKIEQLCSLSSSKDLKGGNKM